MYKDQTVLAVVPARGGSKGIKLKNLQPLAGVPLVARVGHVIRAAPWVDRAIVSTDHPEIAAAAAQGGLDVPFMRPAALSGDRIADWDVLHDALTKLEEMDRRAYDIILLLQPTSPLRRPEHLQAAVAKLVEGGYDSVWSVSPSDARFHPLKQLAIDGEDLQYYDPDGKTIIARQQLNQLYHRNGVVYALTRTCIMEHGDIRGVRCTHLIIDEPMANIDSPLDFQYAEFLLAQRGDAK